MTDAAPQSPPVFRLIYRSHSRIPPHERKAEHGAIFSVARARNKKVGISGALMIFDDWFVQVLEGRERAVRSLYDRLHRDVRHDRLALVEAEEVGGRTFGRWAMAKVAEEEGEPDIPLIMNVTKGGAVPAAPRSTTPDQDRLLQRMRDLLHESAAAG
jgi:Sensors of blue-light using FAD